MRATSAAWMRSTGDEGSARGERVLSFDMRDHDSATPASTIAPSPGAVALAQTSESPIVVSLSNHGRTACAPDPTLDDVLRARAAIRPYLPRTPMFSYPALDAWLGARVFVKHENVQPTGAFKVRGGIHLLAQLTPEARARGVVTSSTGNHGQSIAYAARLFGAQACVVVPERPNPAKVAALRGLGAEVVIHGAKLDDARRHAERLAAERGLTFVSAANEPALVAGVATVVLEMLEQQPNLDAIFVAVGSGSGAAGACLVTAALAPACRVIAVQSAASPAAHASWRAGCLVERGNETFAEGLATGAGYDLPQRLLRAHLSDFVLVGDDEIRAAIVCYLERAHTLAEGAGAAALAGAYRIHRELRGKTIGVVCSGGNSSLEHLEGALAARRSSVVEG
jgi:threonine dehydratase